MSSLVLVAAVMVSLASGVLLAYGVCAGFFALLQRGAVVQVKETMPAADVSVAKG